MRGQLILEREFVHPEWGRAYEGFLVPESNTPNAVVSLLTDRGDWRDWYTPVLIYTEVNPETTITWPNGESWPTDIEVTRTYYALTNGEPSPGRVLTHLGPPLQVWD